MRPSSEPTGTVESSAALMATSTPLAGAGISVSTLSVETSSSGSSACTASPTAFSQRVMVPSVTLSPSAGSTMAVSAPDAAGAAGVGAGAATTSAGGAGVGAGAAGASVCAESAAPMTQSAPPTSTTASSSAEIERSTPLAGAGISVSTLSVDTSSSGSSAVMVSPTALSHRVTVPSVTLSPRAGIVTVTDMCSAPLLVFKRARGGVCPPARDVLHPLLHFGWGARESETPHLLDALPSSR